MIVISKCPYRISLLGGSSDLDWFLDRNKRGVCIGFSMNAYSTVVLKKRSLDQKGILNYSSREEYKTLDNITHPIIRECFRKFNIDQPIELASFGDSLGGSGLGSSSSFSVALVKGINFLFGKSLSNEETAHLASEIEICNLRKSIGRQDQYLSSLGGINILEFREDKKVLNLNYPNIQNSISELVNNLYLVDTCIRRSATSTLEKIKNDCNSYESIQEILKITDIFLKEAQNSNSSEISDLLTDAIIRTWNIKKNMPGVMNNELMQIENYLLKENFQILKLLGAGGGGYFLVKSKYKNIKEVKSKLQKFNLNFQKVKIDFNGAKSWEV